MDTGRDGVIPHYGLEKIEEERRAPVSRLRTLCLRERILGGTVTRTMAGNSLRLTSFLAGWRNVLNPRFRAIRDTRDQEKGLCGENQRKVETDVVAWTGGVRFTTQSEGASFGILGDWA